MQISYIQIEVPGIKRSLLCFLFEKHNTLLFQCLPRWLSFAGLYKDFLLKQTF